MAQEDYLGEVQSDPKDKTFPFLSYQEDVAVVIDGKWKAKEQPKLELLCRLLAQNCGNRVGIFEETYPLPIDMPMVNKEYIVDMFMSQESVARRIRQLRKNYLGALSTTLNYSKLEAIGVLVNRYQSPATHSRDIPSLYEKLSKALKWDAEIISEDDNPLNTLLLSIDPRGSLPMLTMAEGVTDIDDAIEGEK